MKAIIIGLGSMGKRRVRCLQALGIKEITGVDPRADRREEATQKYGIHTLAVAGERELSAADIVVASTPPDRHNEVIRAALRAGKPTFVEASVILEGLEELDRTATSQRTLVAPSCTMRFHAAIRAITSLVRSSTYGRWTGFSYHSGQYLPDWHPWENVKDFYVSNKSTGAAREIVPFELTWIVDTFGFPVRAEGTYGKTRDVGADIDDTYACALTFQNGIGSLTVDVTSRFATRSLILNMEHGQIRWNWEENAIRVFEVSRGTWESRALPVAKAHPGYNVNIDEGMYVEEIDHFLKTIKGEGTYPSSLRDDIRVLQVLRDIERNTP